MDVLWLLWKLRLANKNVCNLEPFSSSRSHTYLINNTLLLAAFSVLICKEVSLKRFLITPVAIYLGSCLRNDKHSAPRRPPVRRRPFKTANRASCFSNYLQNISHEKTARFSRCLVADLAEPRFRGLEFFLLIFPGGAGAMLCNVWGEKRF